MKKANFSFVWNRKKRLNKHEQGAVDIYCYIDGKARFISTGVNVAETEWDNKRRRVSKDHSNSVKLNVHLSRMKNKLEEYELSQLNNKGEFTFVDLGKFSFNGEVKRRSFLDWLKKEIEADTTVKGGTTTYRLNMLEKFRAAAGDGDVTHESLRKFTNYMASEGLKASTQQKLHNQLRKFVTIAAHEKIIKENPYKIYKIKRPVYDQKQCLWYKDLDTLWNLQYPVDSGINIARLRFLFSCYTGLRISDNKNLTWDQVRDGQLFVKMQKTEHTVVVPLDVLRDDKGNITNRPQMILEAIGKQGRKVFPYMPDQTVNKYLKRIGIDAEIPFPLNFHTSRHTFCTLIAHQMGSPYKVMQYAGLQKVDTAQVYVNLSTLFTR
jgi:site-specific recombinase XerD